MALTDTACKQAKARDKSYKSSDGGGLYLEIMPNGRKYWRLKYRFANKEKRLAIGVYPTISLKEAREKREEAKKLLCDGVDPSQHKKDLKHEQILKTDNSFKKIAHEWHHNQIESWTPHHAKTIMRRLEADIFPFIGDIPINEITAPQLLDILRKIEKRGALDIAKRAKQTTGQIFRYAIAIGRAERDISVDLKGALKTALQKNHNYFKENDLPDFLANLDNYDGELLTQFAIKLTLLTFVRTTEIRGAQWQEIDFIKKLWRIPAERMKMRVEHIVPLSNQAIAILERIKNISHNSAFVFPNINNQNKMMSANTMIFALYRMGYHSKATIHGFRATASTILNENGFRSDVIERQLAHGERNKVRASYNHASYLSERAEMMQWWADFIDEKRHHHD